MNKFLLCAALMLTAISGFSQGVKVQAFTTNSGPVVTNIVINLSSNLAPNRLRATNTITGVRVYAATNGLGGFWLDPSTISPGSATNVIDVAAGQNITIVTNGLLRTIIMTNASNGTFNFLQLTNVPQSVSNLVNLTSNNYVGTFTGNASGSTNLALPWKTVGITNGDFGPFTPGTTTSGIQEAIDSFSKGTNGGANGVYLKFFIGNYFYTNQITYSNNWNYQFVWQGAGRYGTRWVYAGTNTGINTIDIKGGGNPAPSLNCSGDILIQDGVFSSILCPTNVLLRITNINATTLTRVTFSGWKTDTMQDWMSTTSGNSDQSDYTVTTNGLVGAVIGNVNDGGLILDDCSVGFLGAGIVAHTDHLKVSWFIDPFCGVNANSEEQTAWPTNHPYRLGAGIIRYPGLDAQYDHFHGYADKLLLALMNYPNSNTEVQSMRNLVLEGSSPAIAAISTNANLFTVDTTSESQGTGIFDVSNQGSINTNDFRFASIAPLKIQGLVYNNPAYLVRPEANGGLHIKTGQLDGNLRGGTNLPGIKPAGRVVRATNSFTVANSGAFNLDGIWTWNATRAAYTNAFYGSAVGALMDDFSAPPQRFVTFTNATHLTPDYLVTIETPGITNMLVSWEDSNFDPVPDMFAYWSESTNNAAVIDGLLLKLRTPADSGGTKALDGESAYLITTSSSTVTLPDVRTNAGRLVFVKADNVTGCSVASLAGQAIDSGITPSLSPYDGILFQAVGGVWQQIARYTTNSGAASSGAFTGNPAQFNSTGGTTNIISGAWLTNIFTTSNLTITLPGSPISNFWSFVNITPGFLQLCQTNRNNGFNLNLDVQKWSHTNVWFSPLVTLVGNGNGLTNVNAGSTNMFHEGATAVGAWTNASGQTVSGGILGTNYETTAYYSVSNGFLRLIGGAGAQSAMLQLSNNVANANSNTVILPGLAAVTNGSSYVRATAGAIVASAASTFNGTLLVEGGAAGDTLSVNVGNAAANNAISTKRTISVDTGAAGQIGLKVTGRAAQTADLFQGLTSTPNLVFRVDAGGNTFTANSDYVTNSVWHGTNTYMGSVAIAPSDTATPDAWMPITNNGTRYYIPLYNP